MAETLAYCMAAQSANGVKRCWTFQTWFGQDRTGANLSLRGSAESQDQSALACVEVLLRNGEPLLIELQLMCVKTKVPSQCEEMLRIQLGEAVRASIPGPDTTLPQAVEQFLEPECIDRLFEMTTLLSPEDRSPELTEKLREFDEMIERVPAR
jgi:hypothetical protein